MSTAKDYRRVRGFIYEDDDGEFLWCACGGRARSVEDTDDYVCEDGCGRTTTTQSSDGGVL